MTRNPKPETRNPKPGTQNPEPETRNPHTKYGTWNLKPGIRNLKPGTRSSKPKLVIRNPKNENQFEDPKPLSHRLAALDGVALQGHLADKKPHPPRTLQYEYI